MCAARLARAAEIATPDDVVVLSGWARVPGTHSEAELMRAAWRGAAREVVVDPDARTTVENMANALNDVLRVGAREVVVVTSRWHAPRAKAALRWLLRSTGVRVRAASTAAALAAGRPARGSRSGRSCRSSSGGAAGRPGRSSAARSGDLDVDPLLRLAQRAALALGADGEDLGEDRERRLVLRVGADVEAAGPDDPRRAAPPRRRPRAAARGGAPGSAASRARRCRTPRSRARRSAPARRTCRRG